MAATINNFTDINRLLTPLLNAEITKGVLVKDIVLTTGVDNVVNHELGESPQGFILVDKNANQDVWKSSTSNPFPARNLLLRSSGTVTISLWIF